MAVDKTFRAFDPHQALLLPSPGDWLPQDRLARFVADLVDEVPDLEPILADYTEKRGYLPDDPRLMLRLLIYGYTTAVRSSPRSRMPGTAVPTSLAGGHGLRRRQITDAGCPG